MNLKKIEKALDIIGLNPIKTLRFLYGLGFIFRDYTEIKKQKGNDKNFFFGRFIPITTDRFDESGNMRGHYFHQDLYVAKLIYKNNPSKHVDIGSRTDGFVAHVAAFREIEIIDIRNQYSKVSNIKFKQADLMELPIDMIDYTDSISSLHAIEHFGLGRYADPIDYFGSIKAINNITKILKVGGTFYFSVPIGPQRIEFNAHRVFSVSYLLDIFKDNFELISISYVDDNGDLNENPTLTEEIIKNNFGCQYGCGIFELRKINNN